MVNGGDGVKWYLAHMTTQTWRCVTETWYDELTLPSAKCCECCHLFLYPPELQCLWCPDSECQAEETEMHGCHFLISHCDNHNVCTESLRGNLWGRYAAGIVTPTKCQRVGVSDKNNNKQKDDASACKNDCKWRKLSVQLPV